jgi:hypothetical protein
VYFSNASTSKELTIRRPFAPRFKCCFDIQHARAGDSNYVIDPASLQVDRRARRVKTDRIDAERLLRSLMAYRRGEPKVWSVVRVSGIVEEDARRLHREPDRLVSERVQHVNRITGLCALHGIYDYHPLRHRLAPRQTQDAEAHAAAAELMRSESDFESGRHRYHRSLPIHGRARSRRCGAPAFWRV